MKYDSKYTDKKTNMTFLVLNELVIYYIHGDNFINLLPDKFLQLLYKVQRKFKPTLFIDKKQLSIDKKMLRT